MPWIDRFGLSVAPDLLDGLQQLRQTFEREELALQRHQDRVRRRHRVHREQIERRRAVDQHIGVVVLRRRVSVQRRDRVAQPESAAGRGAELELEAGEVHRRGRDMQPRHRGRHHRVAQRRFADQHVVGRGVAALAVDAEPGRGVTLRVEVDDQHALADRGQRGAEVDRGRGLADAALLVGKREDARMARRMFRPILLIRLINYAHGDRHLLLKTSAARCDRVRRSSPVRPSGWNGDLA